MKHYPEPPPHIARQQIVGPLVRFRGQSVAVTSSPPRDTLDPRYNACTDHHLACNCREAEQNEMRNEYRSEFGRLRETMRQMLKGHATEVWQRDEHQRRNDLECACTLCEFARAAYLVPRENIRYAPSLPSYYPF